MDALAGKRAVVTGVSQGIGAAIGVALAAAGADVAGIHLGPDDEAARTEAAIVAQGRRTLFVRGDTGDSAAVEGLAARVASAWGGIDVWVNNAARLLVKPFLELEDGDWHGLLAANLHGYFYGCRAAARRMRADGGGSIVNVTSVVDIQPIAELAAYVTAKSAILGLTRTLAVELGPLGIRVNALAPGATDTPLNKTAYTPEVRRNYEARIPLGRIASADEIADAVVFLCTPAARYVNGHQLVVDGGLVLNGNVGHARD